MSNNEKVEYLKSVLRDRIEGYDQQEKIQALLDLVIEEFVKLEPEEMAAYGLTICAISGKLAECAVGEMAKARMN